MRASPYEFVEEMQLLDVAMTSKYIVHFSLQLSYVQLFEFSASSRAMCLSSNVGSYILPPPFFSR